MVRTLRGIATAAEVRKLGEWRGASRRNEQHYQRIVRLWMLVGLVDSAKLHSRPPTAAELLMRTGAQPRVPGPSTAWPPRWATAASVLLVAAGGAGLARRVASDVTLGAAELVTGESQMVTAQLGDGSVVRVAPRSRLRIGGVRGRRDVWLDGRAFFVVAKQPGHPFTVHTRLGDAVALGTRFDLDVGNDGLRLATTEGRVALSTDGAHVEVGRAEVVSIVGGAVSAVVSVDSVPADPDWVGKFLAFQATPLPDVSREIERKYRVRMHIRDPLLAARTVTASFTDESLESVIGVVCRVVDAQCSIQDTGVEMRLPPAAAQSPLRATATNSIETNSVEAVLSP